MSSSNTRSLYQIFLSTQKAANSTQKAKNAIKFTPTTATSTKKQTPIKVAGSDNPRNPWISSAVSDLLNERDSDKLSQKFTSLSSCGFFRRRHYKVYEFVVHRLALAKRSSLIEQTLKTQEKYISGERFAARIIYLYGKAGMFDHAYTLFDEMPERKCVRGVKSFAALLTAAVSARKFDKVYELFRELPPKLSIKPDVDSYNRVVYALSQLGLFDNAVSLLDEMETNGVNPNIVSFNSLIGAFYRKGDIVRGDETWERMIKRGLIPNSKSYNCKLLGLINEGRLTEAIKLVEDLKSKDIKLDLGIYNALIHGSCKMDDLEGAKRWYAELLNDGYKPNKVTFNILISLPCEKGDYGFAFEVCQNMFKGECRSELDEALLQKVVDGLAHNSLMEEAETLVKLASSHSYVPYSLTMPTVG